MARAIKFGLFLTNQHRPGSDLVAALDGQLELVRTARDAGWDSIFVGQHFLPEGMTMLQPAPFLARLAGEAAGMTLGVGILLLALHNPVDVAETWGSMDVVSGGRLVFAVGLGYRQPEYDAFGIALSDRVGRFELNLEIVKRLWSGETVSCETPWCRLHEAVCGTLPVQRPRPPIWLAANSDRAVVRAARLGDTWLINPHATLATVASQLELFRAERTAAGLAPPDELPVIREVCCAPTRQQAFERCSRYLTEKYERYADWGQDKVLPGRDSFRVPLESLSEDRFVVGSPDECTERLRGWRDQLGVNHFLFRTDWIGMPLESSLESIRLLTTEVLPALRAE